jgi:hypothetical protein
MVATLKKWQCWFPKGTFPLMSQIHSADIKAIDQNSQKLLSRNQIQDGCHGYHIEKLQHWF